MNPIYLQNVLAQVLLQLVLVCKERRENICKSVRFRIDVSLIY